MKKAEYMEDHIGEVYNGTISGVCEFGLFIELENTVEGLARIEDLPGDHYLYSKDLNAMLGRRNKNKFVYGDRVTVEVVKASRDTAQIDFKIIKGNPDEEIRRKK